MDNLTSIHRRTRHKTALAFGLAVMLGVMFFCLSHAEAQSTPSKPDAPISLWPVPLETTFTLPAQKLDGTLIDIAQRPGWKIIYFWSASCPCVQACEQYTLRPLAEKYGAKVAFYGIVSGKYELGMNRDDLKSQILSHHLPFPILLDPNHTIAAALNAQVTPQTFLLDPANHIVFSGMPDDTKRYLHATGRTGLTDSYLGDALAQAMAGKKVTRPFIENEGCIIGW